LALAGRLDDRHDLMSVRPGRPQPRLVLWDIDQTLIEVGGATRLAYAAAFAKAVGRPLDQPWAFNGRTELAAVAHVLEAHGVPATPELTDRFIALIVAELHDRATDIRRDGRVLPGAVDALRATGRLAGVHQSVLTGNLYSLAVLKLSIFELSEYFDLRIGAFGGDDVDRVALPAHAWRRAHAHLGHSFAGPDTVIVGDTVLDVATGKGAGARVVAVATGPATQAELGAAGADVVLPDLRDTTAVIAAIAG
jgi:phosphoglycolate phosphatase-like HAD superfamily hydrolase